MQMQRRRRAMTWAGRPRWSNERTGTGWPRRWQKILWKAMKRMQRKMLVKSRERTGAGRQMRRQNIRRQ